MTEQLLKNGWEVIEGESTDDNYLLEISKKYGVPFPDSNGNLIQILKAKERGTGIKNSFSFNYGYSSLPFHTDTAFIEFPSKYFLLTSIFPSETCTNIIDFKQIIESLEKTEISILKSAIFLTKTPEKQSFSNLFFNQDKGLRFDPNIMFPYNSYAKKALKLIESKILEIEPIKIKWNKKNILIIDNWRCLHSRDNVNEINRTLKRIYIK